MNAGTVRGEFEYNGNAYPFVIQDRVMTVVQAAFHYLDDFVGREDLGILTGVTDNNRYILLLDCKVLHSQFLPLSGRVQIALHGYILQDKRDDGYDRLKFSSPAIDAFYSPRKAWTLQFADEPDPTGLTVNPYADSARQITANIQGEAIQCTLDFGSYFNLRLEDRHAVSFITNLSMVFDSRKTAAQLGKYYLYVSDFLSFTSFRRDIPFDSITLWCRGEDGKFRKTGTAVIFRTGDAAYDARPEKVISYDDLGDEAFAALFAEVAQLRNMQSFNPFFLPSGKADSLVVDRAKWLVTAICFEGEFNKKYRHFKAEQSPEFHSAKALLLAAIHQAVADSGVALNNPRNSALKSFRNLIEHCDTTVREKFRFCLEHFSREIGEQAEKYCRQAGVSADAELADSYAQARNRSAHGVIEPLENEDIVVFLLLRCFIYLLIMERAEVPRESRKRILEKLM